MKACLATKMSISVSATATSAPFGICHMANLSEHLREIGKATLAHWPPTGQGLVPCLRCGPAGPPGGRPEPRASVPPPAAAFTQPHMASHPTCALR